MSIHYNQTGYDPRLPKKAVITGNGLNCMILNERDIGAFQQTGKKIDFDLSEPVFDEASGDTVRVLDFSALSKPGKYFIFADGEQAVIEIKEKPYHLLSNALLKGFYFQRCGCELPEKYAGPYRHGVCHVGKAVLVKNDGAIDSGTEIECAGGWHDAGDYGRYIAPAAAALGHLLYAYELFPEAFKDNINIPESGNGVPDILNECRYELEWMLKMQRADGGLYHKVTTRYFSGFIMPEDDKDDLYLFRVTHCSTAGFAASAAQAARVYKNFDAAFAAKLLEAAKKAWDWMEANPGFEAFTNPPEFRSGAYGDLSCEDELFWASAELYSVTGEERYLQALKKRLDSVDISEFGWRDTAGFGALCCLFVLKEKLEENLFSSIKERFLCAADSFLALTKKSGYSTALGADGYVWGSILPILNNAIAMICACQLTGDKNYRNAAQSQLDYLLGMNATGYSFVTGFGERAFRFPHHRPSFADGVDAPVPGLVSGGPNKRNPDMVTKALIPPDTPAAKFYIDYTPTASANEIAIYWNSPAVFVAAYFDGMYA
ncbi:MAG: glycoside hydrolase family 9 protein [Treponema sp.]|jgi:endoglucanase|nr:glycoside hydrolase family 9 protein [Treponema sp.]